MGADVHKLPASAHLTVQQALDLAQRDFSGARDVLMLFCNADGELCIRSSHMNRMEALWLLEKAKAHTLDGEA